MALFRKYISYIDITFCEQDLFHLFNYRFMEVWQSLALHESQFVWFRRLSVIFSRYTLTNSFQRWIQTDSAEARRNKEKDPKAKVEDDGATHA